MPSRVVILLIILLSIVVKIELFTLSKLYNNKIYNDNIFKLFSNKINNDNKVVELIDTLNQSYYNEDFIKPLWDVIKYESTTINEDDPQASALISTAITSQLSLPDAIINYVAHLLETPLLTATQVRNLFKSVTSKNETILAAWAVDLMAHSLRDSSLPNAVSVLLFHKGFHALVVQRITHSLWLSDRRGLANYFQSLGSRVFTADVHPAACIGQGIVIASGCNIVIGETASVGNECCLMQGVTLGGTGKETDDRHPKLGNGVFVAADATILGNIHIGDGSIVNARSVVTKPVESFTRVGGVPAKVIAKFDTVKYDVILEQQLSALSYQDDPIPTPVVMKDRPSSAWINITMLLFQLIIQKLQKIVQIQENFQLLVLITKTSN